MHLGSDIDGVISDTLAITLDLLNGLLGRRVTPPDCLSYDLSQVYGITQAEIATLLQGQEGILASAEPIPGATTVLARLHRTHRITLVSARPAHWRPATEEWLRRWGIPYDHLLLLGQHDKRQALQEAGIQVFMEDRLQNALEISASGIPVLLFTAPHNGGDLPPLVRRVGGWLEAETVLLGEDKNLLRAT